MSSLGLRLLGAAFPRRFRSLVSPTYTCPSTGGCWKWYQLQELRPADICVEVNGMGERLEHHGVLLFISGSVSFVSGLRAQGFDLSRALVVIDGPSARVPRAKELRRKLVRDSTHLQKLDFTTLCISHKKLGGVTAGKFMCAF